MIILLIILIFIIFMIVRSYKKEKELRQKLNIPKESKKIRYYEGYLENLNPVLYFWHDNNSISLCDPKGDGKHIIIFKENILNFNMIGEYHESINVTGGKTKGGGVSIVGAVTGGAIAGPLGVAVAGRKKVKSKPVKTTKTVTDTRKTVLKFMEDGQEKGMILDKIIYDNLCFICPEKKIQ